MNANNLFKISVDTYVTIRGCPKTGPEAIDFRRAHQLPENRADNRHPVSAEWWSEADFRKLVEAGYSFDSFSDGTCVLRAREGSGGFPSVSTGTGSDTTTSHGASRGWRASVSTATIKAGAMAILLAIADDSPQKRDERDERERRLRELRGTAKEIAVSAKEIADEIDSIERELDWGMT